jgi:hypothetical protein
MRRYSLSHKSAQDQHSALRLTGPNQPLHLPRHAANSRSNAVSGAELDGFGQVEPTALERGILLTVSVSYVRLRWLVHRAWGLYSSSS